MAFRHTSTLRPFLLNTTRNTFTSAGGGRKFKEGVKKGWEKYKSYCTYPLDHLNRLGIPPFGVLLFGTSTYMTARDNAEIKKSLDTNMDRMVKVLDDALEENKETKKALQHSREENESLRRVLDLALLNCVRKRTKEIGDTKTE